MLGFFSRGTTADSKVWKQDVDAVLDLQIVSHSHRVTQRYQRVKRLLCNDYLRLSARAPVKRRRHRYGIDKYDQALFVLMPDDTDGSSLSGLRPVKQMRISTWKLIKQSNIDSLSHLIGSRFLVVES